MERAASGALTGYLKKVATPLRFSNNR